ncbi:MAG: amidohydrolase [Candidatus Cloacimonetes bacterium]|jgi:N-acetyldiaminopimelate deacetylase|nr:amidohydrolase [Candidatus Cloacimonadota bacterium]MDD3563592.1 amidohydrolase [Candidatus Cloacimonadota bacterium]MDD4277247.1 amidohydrolase [Candidatus Cloacimonadota bacterium]MDY0326232.1 amidohydrolase [Candidatus Cloacimonadaceae bacterium]
MFDPISLRHELHKIPEIAYQEHKTKALILKYLQALTSTRGVKELFEIIEFSQSNGILVVYAASAEGDDFQLFRADMDALPSDEQTGCDFASEHEGMMHACGHDVHMAVLMGLIQRVWIMRPKCNLLFLFQPAEEGEGGAESILAEGILQRYPISSAFALHVGSDMPVGTVSSKAGIFFGIPQEFDLKFIGKAAHVAFPEKGINALTSALDFFSSIQPAIEDLKKTERVIFHVGKMTAGKIRNIIADECLLQGTHRTLNVETKHRVSELIQTHAGLAAAKSQAEMELKFLGSFDPVVNDAALVERLKCYCTELGYEFTPAETQMTGEDFGFFTSIYPGLMYWLGSGSDQALHSKYFLPEDGCINVGIDLMWALATGLTIQSVELASSGAESCVQ